MKVEEQIFCKECGSVIPEIIWSEPFWPDEDVTLCLDCDLELRF